jgi:hypothetical protein
MKTIHAYYESVPMIRQEEEFSCANFWKTSWERRGWKTLMLNKTHAAASPLMRMLMQRYVNDAVPQLFCSRFTRWCALHAAGGGWMSDYDLLNLGFTPDEAVEIEVLHPLQLVAGKRSYIFYATKEKTEEVIRKFIDGPLIVGGLPRPESEIVGHKKDFLSPMLTKLFHADTTEEMSRSQQLAAAL